MSALDELKKKNPIDMTMLEFVVTQAEYSEITGNAEHAAADLAALNARVKAAEENWHKNEAKMNHMNDALFTCVMFLVNTNTITEEKQVELIKSLRMAGLVDLADSVAAGGFASVFEGAE